ncbi:hypothetical protein [Aerosakkonema funiforme]|uniref:hypothetical protein n=1 Tax=Aerosakkonema funiforme TaxID=1246630 RepID=UPI0035BA2B79
MDKVRVKKQGIERYMEKAYRISGANACFSYPIVDTADLEATFLELAEQWRRETGMMSLIMKMSMHPAYQRIIGMGQAVVPLILRDLEKEPDHWFWALQAITGANPVKSEQRGRLQQMAQAWLQWGRENGYRW